MGNPRGRPAAGTVCFKRWVTPEMYARLDEIVKSAKNQVSPIVEKALAMCAESDVRMSVNTPDERVELETKAREWLRQPLFKPSGKL